MSSAGETGQVHSTLYTCGAAQPRLFRIADVQIERFQGGNQGWDLSETLARVTYVPPEDCKQVLGDIAEYLDECLHPIFRFT
jgi:hypothetical protein